MRKKCRRKIWAKVDPINHAIKGAAITDDESLAKLELIELSALESMAKGHGTWEDWDVLANCVNIAEVMSRSGIGVEVLTVCEAAEKELRNAAERFKRIQKMGLTGLGIQNFRELMEFVNLQRRSISRGEFERMIEKTMNCIRSNHHKVVHIT